MDRSDKPQYKVEWRFKAREVGVLSEIPLALLVVIVIILMAISAGIGYWQGYTRGYSAGEFNGRSEVVREQLKYIYEHGGGKLYLPPGEYGIPELYGPEGLIRWGKP